MTGEPGGFYLEKGGLRPVRDIRNLQLLHHVAEMRKNQKGSGAVRQPPPISKKKTMHPMCTVLLSANCIDGLAFNFKKEGSKKIRAIPHEPPRLGNGFFWHLIGA